MKDRSYRKFCLSLGIIEATIVHGVFDRMNNNTAGVGVFRNGKTVDTSARV